MQDLTKPAIFQIRVIKAKVTRTTERTREQPKKTPKTRRGGARKIFCTIRAGTDRGSTGLRGRPGGCSTTSNSTGWRETPSVQIL